VNPSERQQAIVDHIDATGVCSYQDLAQLLKVSEMTIRRDVDRLVQGARAIKTLGGVQTAHAAEHLYESPVQQRLPIHRREKEQIAREAVLQIQPPQTVFLDGSTTCLVLARHLAKRMRGLTVVTHSALVSLAFGQSAGNTLFSLGGQLDPTSACFTGPTAEEAAGRFFVDVAFFSTKGFLPEEGTFESSIATFRIKQIVAAQAARVALLVDHSKFGQRALCKVLDIGQIHEVITDRGAPSDVVRRLEKRGVVVRIEAEDHRSQEAARQA
jgi:DeoR/GlpR family transcriptional regulator of sugar metabolism